MPQRQAWRKRLWGRSQAGSHMALTPEGTVSCSIGDAAPVQRHSLAKSTGENRMDEMLKHNTERTMFVLFKKKSETNTAKFTGFP